MSRQDEIKQVISMHNRRLQILEKKSAADGSNTPPNILMEIDDIKTTIANLQSELEGLEHTKVEEPPEKIHGLFYATRDALSEFRHTFSSLSSELDYIPPAAQANVSQLLRQAEQKLLELEKEWNGLNVKSETVEEALKAIQSSISVVLSDLNTLILRRNYRRRHNLLEEKLASQQLALTQEQLQTTLQPQMSQIQVQIQSLQDKEKLSPHDQNMLKIYQRNLELCQQILAGKQLYAPLTLLNELSELEQTLTEIDIELGK